MVADPFLNFLMKYTILWAGVDFFSVHCGPLQLYLDDLQLNHIHFFSLDVETAEIYVLNTIDFAQTLIDVLLIESRNRMCKRQCEKRDQVRKFMISHGFHIIHGFSDSDDLYVNSKASFCRSNINTLPIQMNDTNFITYACYFNLYVEYDHQQWLKDYIIIDNQTARTHFPSSTIHIAHDHR
eukprot:334313_1